MDGPAKCYNAFQHLKIEQSVDQQEKIQRVSRSNDFVETSLLMSLLLNSVRNTDNVTYIFGEKGMFIWAAIHRMNLV